MKTDCGNTTGNICHFQPRGFFSILAISGNNCLRKRFLFFSFFFLNFPVTCRSPTRCLVTAAETTVCSGLTRSWGSYTRKRCSTGRLGAPICWRFSLKMDRSRRDLAKTSSPTQVREVIDLIRSTSCFMPIRRDAIIYKKHALLSSSGENDWRKCNQMGFLFHYYFPRAAQKS